MKARLIKFENGDIHTRVSLFSLPRDKEEPRIFITKHDVDIIHIRGNKKLSEFINVDKIPDGVAIQRQKWDDVGGVVYFSKDTITIRILTKVNIFVIQRLVKSIIDTVSNYGVVAKLSPHRINSNDIVFEKDGKLKKFCGIMTNEKDIIGFFITLDIDIEKIRGLYKLEHDKFKKRGEVKDIGDIIGSLKEINPEINITIIDEIIQSFAKKMNWEIEDSFLNEEETIEFNKNLEANAKEEWIYNAIR